jgi:hypothetical protein
MLAVLATGAGSALVAACITPTTAFVALLIRQNKNLPAVFQVAAGTFQKQTVL